MTWKCQLCLYSPSSWERHPESLVFETASSIHIKSKQKIKRGDWRGWFGFGEGNGCFWAAILQLASSGHVSGGEQVMAGYKRASVCWIMCFWSPCYNHGSPLAFLLLISLSGRAAAWIGVGGRCHSPFCCGLVWRWMLHRENTLFIPWLLAVWPARCSVDTLFIVNQICEQGRLNWSVASSQSAQVPGGAM